MNEIETFHALRPDVHPLATEQRAAMRAELFGGVATAVAEHGTAAVLADLDPPDAPWLDDRDHVDRVVPLSPRSRRREPRRRLVAAAAAAVVALGVGGIWAFGESWGGAPAPAQQPDAGSLPGNAPAPEPSAIPEWYTVLRPLLPDGFDQIALTNAQPEVVGFVAFRSDTRQVLDVTVTLVSGYDTKDTGEVATFADAHGTYIEGVSSVFLRTPDDRQVSLSCGLTPIGGGAVGAVSMADSVRDYCGDGFDNLGLDFKARRALAAHLAASLSTATITPTFGQPSDAPETARTVEIVRRIVGDDQMLFPAGRWGGVARSTPLSTEADGLPDTELTIVHGVTMPRAADAAPANRLESPNPPGARFHLYDDVAVAFVVADDGTGYHVITSDLTDDHLDTLGALLTDLAAPPDPSVVDDPIVSVVDDPIVNDATTPAMSTTTVPGSPTLLGDLLSPHEAVLVVNASGVDGLGEELSAALRASGYDVREPITALDTRPQSAVFFDGDAFPGGWTELLDALRIGAAETLDVLTLDGIDSSAFAHLHAAVVLGRDAATAPWRDAPAPLVPPTAPGRLLILDATSTDTGRAEVLALAERLRAYGVDVLDVQPATDAFVVEGKMLMPIGETTRWTYAVNDMALVGGFDGWSPNLLDGDLPDGVTAVLAVGDPAS